MFFCFLFTVCGLRFCDFVVLKLQNCKLQMGILKPFGVKNNQKVHTVSVCQFMTVSLLAVCLKVWLTILKIIHTKNVYFCNDYKKIPLTIYKKGYPISQ